MGYWLPLLLLLLLLPLPLPLPLSTAGREDVELDGCIPVERRHLIDRDTVGRIMAEHGSEAIPACGVNMWPDVSDGRVKNACASATAMFMVQFLSLQGFSMTAADAPPPLTGQAARARRDVSTALF